MAIHFLDHEFQLHDHVTDDLKHGLELFENGGQLFMRIWIGGIGANMPVICRVDPAEAREIANSAERWASRLGA
jgi:hypothetical protein